METITTGRPLDEGGNPTDGPGLELDPEGPAAERFEESPHPLTSSPGAGMWSALLESPDESAGRPTILLWLAPDATELPAHVHSDEAERFRSLEGEITIVVEGEPRHLEPGEETTVRPGEEHYFRNDTDGFVAMSVELPWTKTADTQFTFFGLDHEGAFGSGGEYGEPGFLQGIVTSEAVSEETTITVAPLVVQKVMWATVGRVAKTLGHRAVHEKYLQDEFWEATVEQPEL